jgi:hypothetical protein
MTRRHIICCNRLNCQGHKKKARTAGRFGRHNSAFVAIGKGIVGDGALEKVPMFARIDAPQILFLAAGSILVVGIAYLF